MKYKEQYNPEIEDFIKTNKGKQISGAAQIRINNYKRNLVKEEVKEPLPDIEYAMYKGEELLAMGTIEELAKELNVKKATLKFYLTNSYKARIEGRKSTNSRSLVSLEDDEDEI